MLDLGDRMKSYERVYDSTLTPNSCLFVRVDGKAFHSFTRHCVKPFDHDVIEAMVKAACDTAEQMQGFKGAYVQSDECTFMLTDFDSHNTEGWFGYRLNKIVSITAAYYTAYFNRHYPVSDAGAPPVFDARAFIVPRDDAANMFVWRQRDWHRNSLTMLAQAHFTPRRLHKVNAAGMRQLLADIDVSWDDLKPVEREGTFITRRLELLHERLSYSQFDDLLFGV